MELYARSTHGVNRPVTVTVMSIVGLVGSATGDVTREEGAIWRCEGLARSS